MGGSFKPIYTVFDFCIWSHFCRNDGEWCPTPLPVLGADVCRIQSRSHESSMNPFFVESFRDDWILRFMVFMQHISKRKQRSHKMSTLFVGILLNQLVDLRGPSSRTPQDRAEHESGYRYRKQKPCRIPDDRLHGEFRRGCWTDPSYHWERVKILKEWIESHTLSTSMGCHSIVRKKIMPTWAASLVLVVCFFG